jgi:hypothetical protein
MNLNDNRVFVVAASLIATTGLVTEELLYLLGLVGHKDLLLFLGFAAVTVAATWVFSESV